MQTAQPFRVMRNQTVITGGWLNGPWVVEEKEVEGKLFMVLDKQDRRLARAVGMDMSQRSPWGNNRFLAHLAHLRDARVDQLIHEARLADDPLAARDTAELEVEACKVGRMKQLKKYNIPTIVAIKYPSFITTNGARVEETVVNVISTPKRGAVVTMELTDENIEWMAMAAPENTFEVPQPTREPGVGAELKSLPSYDLDDLASLR